MEEILAGAATSAQIAGFIVALRMKGETVEELAGLLEAMSAAAERVPLADVDGVVDIVGTGGDRSHSVNVSTMAAIVVAGAGVRVCKHGNRAASSRCGSADLLEALGVDLELDPAGVARCVEQAGIGFCFAPRFHPAMRHAVPTRRELGVPTVFNFLGPLANPAGVRRQVVGVADAGDGRADGARCSPPGARSGCSSCTATTGSTSSRPPPRRRSSRWSTARCGASTVDPTALGLPLVEPSALTGGDAAVNADGGPLGVRRRRRRRPRRRGAQRRRRPRRRRAGRRPRRRAWPPRSPRSTTAAPPAALERLVAVSRA